MEDASLRSNLIPEIVGIARAVGAEVVGEGVENAAQAMALKHMGVRYGQGYHFARPMPINELARHLLARRTPTPDLARAA
jgi:EAL domain-containing protein (putative c-di-GMP-specific phosphodiesterase class I)